MYGKLFSSMYDGTLYGQWQGIVTLQQLVILADEDGMVDMTPPAIAAKTSIPLEIIAAGIEQLSEADKYSRSAAEEGRRIVLLDESRPWGWHIVNYQYYRDLASREEKKRKDRERIAEKRNKNKGVADCRKVSQSVADVAYTDTDTDTRKTKTSRKQVALDLSPLPDDISPSIWADFLKVREKKKKPLTDTAIARLANALEKCRQIGFPPDEALGMACERGWVSVDPEWMRRADKPAAPKLRLLSDAS